MQKLNYRASGEYEILAIPLALQAQFEERLMYQKAISKGHDPFKESRQAL